MQSDDWRFILATILTSTGIAAAIVFNFVYFIFVLPAMKRRNGLRVPIQAVFGLIHGQVFEYCRVAKRVGTGKDRKIALMIKVSLAMFALAFLGLGVLLLTDPI
jgi:hypothetical protein